MGTITFTLSESGGVLVSSPESQNVTESNTTTIFQLAPNAAADFRLTGYSSNDSKSQLGPASINKEGTVMTLLDANSKAEMINVTVLAEHRKQGTQHSVDPVIINIPPD
jgi:hypothetical protein